MIQVQLDPEAERELAQEARNKGIDLTTYIKTILLERPDREPALDVQAIDRAIATLHEIRSRSKPGPESMKELISEGRKY